MDVIEKENLLEHASKVGAYLLGLCKELQSRHLAIGDVRGVGLFIGIELVFDRDSKIPATKLAETIVAR